MITATITKTEYNSLLLVKAKKDVRYYLNGLHINVPKKQIEATNGHRMLRVSNVPIEDDNTQESKPRIIDVSIKAPVRANLVNITLNDQNAVISFIDSTERVLMSFNADYIDGIFPDCNRVIPIEDAQVELKEIAFNPTYLADITKLYEPKFPIIKIKLYKDKITAKFNDNVLLVVMTARV